MEEGTNGFLGQNNLLDIRQIGKAQEIWSITTVQ